MGCVVVNDAGELVGEGFHPKAGEPHAEVFALRDAGDKAKGATAYVSLEPCNHTGRTPPCVDALLKAGVRSVVLLKLMLGLGPVHMLGIGLDVDGWDVPLLCACVQEGDCRYGGPVPPGGGQGTGAATRERRRGASQATSFFFVFSEDAIK